MINVEGRWEAFLIHLLISAAIFFVLALIIFYVWFPNVFIHMGGIQGLKIVAAVDLVLGPILTLIVFDKAKKSLKWDLAAVGAFQAACLIVGVYFVYQERPIAQVLSDDGVHVITAGDVKKFSLQKQFSAVESDISPKWHFFNLPDTALEKKAVKMMIKQSYEYPLVFHTGQYVSPSEISQEKFDNRIQSLPETIDDPDCIGTRLFSKHLVKMACIDKDKGVVKLLE